MMHRTWLWLSRLFGRPRAAPGRYVGRGRTRDSISKKDAPKVESLEQQLEKLHRESCLTAGELPGELLPERPAYRIWFFDIDGKRVPQADILRLLAAENGFGALVEPELRYLQLVENIPPHLYYPQNKKIAWRKLSRDPKQRKIFVEGAKKAACATSFGFPSIGIQGCWGWRSKKHGLMFLPEFTDYDLKDCHVFWVPDHDRKPEAIADILRASNAFGLVFQERGAKFHLVWLPLLEGFKKVGIDDFLFHYSRGGRDTEAGQDAFEELLAATPEWQDFEITEPGNAKRWVSMYGSRFHFVAPRRWLVYRNGCWREDSHIELQETTKEMFEGMLDDARHSGNTERFSFLRKHVTRQRIDNVPHIAKSDPTIVTEPEQFDKHLLFVNCQNGTLEMPLDAQGELRFREHNPDDLLTKTVSVAWNPTSTCAQFLRALNVWTQEDRKLQRTIQQLLGISCTGVTREQVFVILYGPSATGKSTFIEICREILADYAVTLSSDTLLVRRHGQPEERKLAPLPGARFASSSETEQGGKLDENLIKQLSGEDNVKARLLYQESFGFDPQAKIWLRTNNRPEIRDAATWRRLIALPFGRVIPKEKQDAFLKEKLRKELEGIFVWMVRGYLDYAKNGLVLADIVHREIETYRKEQDVLGRFLEEKCELKPKDFVEGRTGAPLYSMSRETLYAAFVQWCRDANIHVVMTNPQFKSELVNRFHIEDRRVTVDKKQEWRFVGIATKEALRLVQSAQTMRAKARGK